MVTKPSSRKGLTDGKSSDWLWRSKQNQTISISSKTFLAPADKRSSYLRQRSFPTLKEILLEEDASYRILDFLYADYKFQSYGSSQNFGFIFVCKMCIKHMKLTIDIDFRKKKGEVIIKFSKLTQTHLEINPSRLASK